MSVIEEYIAPDLAVVKAMIRAQINSHRDRLASGPVATPTGPVDADPASVQKINGAVVMAMLAMQAAQPFALDWTMADNSRSEHSAAQIVAMGQAVAVHVATCHAVAAALKAALEAAPDMAAIAGLDIAAAPWPAVWSPGP